MASNANNVSIWWRHHAVILHKEFGRNVSNDRVTTVLPDGTLARFKNYMLRMRRECRERFPRHRRVTDPDMHHGTCVTHVPWCMPGSLTSGFLWSWWRGKGSRHSRRMRNPQFCVSGKRPMAQHRGCKYICRHSTGMVKFRSQVCPRSAKL